MKEMKLIKKQNKIYCPKAVNIIRGRHWLVLPFSFHPHSPSLVCDTYPPKLYCVSAFSQQYRLGRDHADLKAGEDPIDKPDASTKKNGRDMIEIKEKQA